MSLSAGCRVGSFEILGHLGSGGMGVVYRARDTKLGRDVALKLVPDLFASDPDRLARFTREAQTLAALNHPNIAHLHGLEESGGVRALVMELVEGEDLAQRLARGPIPVDEALPIARQIAEALEAAHEQGIIHRDLKPANIKVRDDGTVKVLDFGLAKSLPGHSGGSAPGAAALANSPTLTSPAVTQAGIILGTAAYMSPEQARGRPLDKRTDIWAFGAVLFEMLTGTRAFAGLDVQDTFMAIMRDEPDWARLPARLSPALGAYIRRCLQKDPRQRIHDIADVRLALDGAFDEQAEVDKSATTRSSPQPWRRSLSWVLATLMVSVGVMMAIRGLQVARDDRIISFAMQAPRGSQFARSTMSPHPALSHDGRQLAFVAQVDSTPTLWVQTVGEMHARALPGAAEPLFPFWSPDAAFVGFASAGRLRKIAVSGNGAAQDICACTAEFGGTWSADGTIVFAGTTGLFRVSAAGGEARMLTQIDRSLGELSHRFPVLLPDGRRFLYLIRSTQHTHRGLYLGAMDDPGLKRRLVPDDSNGSLGVGADGEKYLFFVRDLELLAQKFDMSRGQLSGDAVIVVRQVIPGEGGRFAPFAVAGRALVYRPAEQSQTRLVWMDRRGIPGRTLGRVGEAYAYPSLSPDGKRLAVAKRDPKTGIRDIWLIDVERGQDERLTKEPVTAGFPLWTPNGDKVVYGSTRSGPWEIYARSSDGSGREESLLPTANAEPFGWPRHITRDGRFLLIGSGRRLSVQPLDGRSPGYPLAEASQGQVSPDGRWVAYSGSERDERQVYVTTFPKPSSRWRVSPSGGEDVQWKQDGKELYYVSNHETLMAVPVPDAPAFDRVVPQPLFRASFDRYSLAFGSAYSPAPDGQRFLVVENPHNETPVLNVVINWTLGGR